MYFICHHWLPHLPQSIYVMELDPREMVYFFKYILMIMLLHLSHFFLPVIPLCPAPHPPPMSTLLA